MTKRRIAKEQRSHIQRRQNIIRNDEGYIFTDEFYFRHTVHFLIFQILTNNRSDGDQYLDQRVGLTFLCFGLLPEMVFRCRNM